MKPFHPIPFLLGNHNIIIGKIQACIHVFLTTEHSESIINWDIVEEVFTLAVRILSVTSGSPADLAGIRKEERILSINGEEIYDEIDYQALTANENLSVSVDNGTMIRELHIIKEEWEPLGLCLDETQIMKPRHCCNHCLFCFVDQLPQGMRSSLYVKDDDWRHSLMMGNYVTLTNVTEQEFQRILRRKASPLYISVHATDPEVRCRMLRNPKARNLMERLKKLKDNGLEFHCQIVLCPDINDGDILSRSIDDLASLWPAARSLAIVPVGLTMHREGLTKLRRFNAVSAASMLEMIHSCQERFLKELGTRFVFPSDEFYCICHQPLPEANEYEDYPQIENGVGMLRLLDQECREAAEDLILENISKKPSGRRILIPTGVSARPFIQDLVNRYTPEGTDIQVIAVKNNFFGETITVTGLIVGRDLISALQGIKCDEILICDTMLRENTNRFLDDMTLEEVCNALGCPVRVIPNNGESLIRALWKLEDENG